MEEPSFAISNHNVTSEYWAKDFGGFLWRITMEAFFAGEPD